MYLKGRGSFEFYVSSRNIGFEARYNGGMILLKRVQMLLALHAEWSLHRIVFIGTQSLYCRLNSEF
jgi:hypothetical protein